MTLAATDEFLADFLRPANPRLFDAPAWMPDGRYDIVVIGVPSDAGNLGSARSAAAGISVLRNAARLFPYRKNEEDQPIGWYDYELRRTLLQGIYIADAGDLAIDRNHPSATLDRLPEVLRALRRNARLVLVLGGDHSISYWTAAALPKGGRVVVFDAHEDATSITSTLPHAGNVVRFLERQETIASILQYGQRGLVPGDRVPPADHRYLCADRDAFESALFETAQMPTLLSIDVDVISPDILRSVAAPSPCGLRPMEVVEVARAIGTTGGSVEILEIVEFAPAPGDDALDGMTVAQLVLRLLDICLGDRF